MEPVSLPHDSSDLLQIVFLFGCPHTVLQQAPQRGNFFCTLFVGGSVGRLLNGRHPRGVTFFVFLFFDRKVIPLPDIDENQNCAVSSVLVQIGNKDFMVAHIQCYSRHPRGVIFFCTLFVGGSVGRLLNGRHPRGVTFFVLSDYGMVILEHLK